MSGCGSLGVNKPYHTPLALTAVTVKFKPDAETQDMGKDDYRSQMPRNDSQGKCTQTAEQALSWTGR